MKITFPITNFRLPCEGFGAATFDIIYIYISMMYSFFSDAKILTQTTLDMMQELGDCERCRKPSERSQRSQYRVHLP